MATFGAKSLKISFVWIMVQKMDKVLQHYHGISGQYKKTEIFQWDQLYFFIEIDFYMNKTFHRHWRMGQVLAVIIFLSRKILIHYGLSSCKWPPLVTSDHLGNINFGWSLTRGLTLTFSFNLTEMLSQVGLMENIKDEFCAFYNQRKEQYGTEEKLKHIISYAPSVTESWRTHFLHLTSTGSQRKTMQENGYRVQPKFRPV